MITRTAIFEGQIEPGREEAFFTEIHERLVPLWRQFPGALDVRFWRIAQRDDGAPAIVMMQQVDYPSVEVMEAALASPVRSDARATTLDILRMFDGRFYHVVSDGGLEPRA